MMPEQQLQMANESTRQRPFPWHCPKCRKKEVRPAIISYCCDMAHDGRLYSVTVPELTVPRCGRCGELVFNYPAEEQIRNALRSQLHLLTHDEIRSARTASSSYFLQLGPCSLEPSTIHIWERPPCLREGTGVWAM
jgi:hypothetical protein